MGTVSAEHLWTGLLNKPPWKVPLIQVPPSPPLRLSPVGFCRWLFHPTVIRTFALQIGLTYGASGLLERLGWNQPLNPGRSDWFVKEYDHGLLYGLAVILLEELGTRWLFLSALPSGFGLKNPGPLLNLCQSLLYAAVHLGNPGLLPSHLVTVAGTGYLYGRLYSLHLPSTSLNHFASESLSRTFLCHALANLSSYAWMKTKHSSK